MKCPKCGSERPTNPWFYYCFDCTLVYARRHRGHEEKVKE